MGEASHSSNVTEDRKSEGKSLTGPISELDEPTKTKQKSSPGNAQMNSKQMERMKSSIMTKKEKMLQAKEEEKNFVEFRKQQILYEFRPTSQVTKNKSDESFPRRKRGVSMGFGEQKAKLLGMRPDPKYATWFGKKHIKRETKKLLFHTHLTTPAPPKPKLEAATEAAKSIILTAADDDEMIEPLVRKGNRSGKVLEKNGEPFWKNCEPDDEMEEDDCIVNFEVLDKIFNGEMKLEDPYDTRKKFDPFASVRALSKLDETFEKKFIFSNTIRTVVELHEERGKIKDLGDPEPLEIVWAENMTKTSYNHKTGKENWKSKEEPLKDIVKK